MSTTEELTAEKDRIVEGVMEDMASDFMFKAVQAGKETFREMLSELAESPQECQRHKNTVAIGCSTCFIESQEGLIEKLMWAVRQLTAEKELLNKDIDFAIKLFPHLEFSMLSRNEAFTSWDEEE